MTWDVNISFTEVLCLNNGFAVSLNYLSSFLLQDAEAHSAKLLLEFYYKNFGMRKGEVVTSA